MQALHPIYANSARKGGTLKAMRRRVLHATTLTMHFSEFQLNASFALRGHTRRRVCASDALAATSRAALGLPCARIV
jgi:hypothetical protein